MILNYLTSKWWLALASFAAIFTPLYPLLWCIILVCSFDMVTAISRDVKNNKEKKGFFEKLWVVKSRKLRRTFTKTSLYLIIIMLLHACSHFLLGAAVALWISKAAIFSILSHELFSCGENLNAVTGSNIFSKIIKGSVKKVNEWLNKQIEDEKQ